jgi:hypothetical protein
VAITDIITPDFIRNTYMFGVDKTDDDGTDFPDEMFYVAITSAIQVLESELSIVLRDNKTVTAERHDVRSWEGDTYYLKVMDKRPILEITELAIRFAAFQASILPISWAHVVAPKQGQVQIMPGPEGLEGFAFSGGVPILGIDVLVPREYTPRWLQYSYIAGFEEDLTGTVEVVKASAIVAGTDTLFTSELHELDFVKINGETKRVLAINSDTELVCNTKFADDAVSQTVRYLNYPLAIIDAVGLLSSMLPFDTAGDLIIGAGISSLSLSMDGISQSIQTTSGVENSGYGARLIQYRKRLESLLTTLKGAYKATRVMVI